MQEVPRPFHSIQVEDEFLRTQTPAFVPIEERVNGGPHLVKFPLPSDRYHLDWNQPVSKPVSIDVRDITVEKSGSQEASRYGYEADIRWANTPWENYRPLNPAKLRGHTTGGVGIRGLLITDEINESLGGSYVAQMVPFSM